MTVGHSPRASLGARSGMPPLKATSPMLIWSTQMRPDSLKNMKGCDGMNTGPGRVDTRRFSVASASRSAREGICAAGS
jgi:hypothetical protein